MNTEILRLEDEITKLTSVEGKTTHFEKKCYKEFSDEEDLYCVSAYTYNSVTNETFLLKKSLGRNSYLVCLNDILDYVINSKVYKSSFTVNWCTRINGRLGNYNTSYFYCENMPEVIEKFFHNKKVDDYVIHEIILNPTA
jgi:hypothetical protein